MIIDRVENLSIYENIDENITAGLIYISTVDPSVAIGEYIISDNVKVIVSEYWTREVTGNSFEAHKNVIDIQFPILGQEMVQWAPLSGMERCTEYDIGNDRTYYRNPVETIDCIIGKGVFAIYFPTDAHNPQNAVGSSREIKKITVKVTI